jgi:hypothetical protein
MVDPALHLRSLKGSLEIIWLNADRASDHFNSVTAVVNY